MRLVLVLTLLSFASACRSTAPDVVVGAALSAHVEELDLAHVLATPEVYDGRELVLSGAVREVCAKKGCWLVMADGERELRMTFRDYAFFVPLDSAGTTLRAQGVFRIQETPVDEARHYLEDAGRHAEAQAITAPVRSFTFEAAGVELFRP
jgi:hypothetical protein